MIKCPQCGAPNAEGRTNCYSCSGSLAPSQTVVMNPPASPVFGAPVFSTPPQGFQVTHPPRVKELLAILLAIAVTALFALHTRSYEYKVLVVESQRNEYGEGALSVAERSLADLGRQGWELVGVVDDVETSFPNFGNAEYHTGIKSNTHTKSAHILFKRTRWLFGLI